jgi:hypothetical protein
MPDNAAADQGEGKFSMRGNKPGRTGVYVDAG